MIKKSCLAAISFLVFMLTLASFCYSSGDVSFKAFVDKSKASLGDGIELSLQFSGTSQMPAPEIPEIEGFQIRYLGPSTRLSMVNGITEQSVTHRYLLVPLKEGVFQIGPFSVTYKGATYTSDDIKLTITKGAVFQNTSASSYDNQVPENLNDRIFLSLETNRSEVYLNEAIPLTITLYSRGIPIRDIQFPELSGSGLTIGPFEHPQQFRQTYNGMVYDVVQFKTRVYAAHAGDFTLGPAHLKCNLLIRKPGRAANRGFESFFDQDFFESFFGGYETMSIDLKSSALPLTVRAFPDEGRPKDFKGAIGDFIFSASVSPREVNIGDPVTVKMTIKGEGNFNNVSCPVMTSEDGFKIYEPQIKEEDNQKTFEQIILPQKGDIHEVPSFSFSFFNPRLDKYETLSAGPFSLKVNATGQEHEAVFVETAKPSDSKIEEEENLGKGIVYIKSNLGNFKKEGTYLYQSIPFWLFQIFILSLFVSMILWANRNEKLKTDIAYARSLQAPKKAKKCLLGAQQLMKSGDVKGFYDTIFRSLREYLGDRYHLSSGVITWKILEDILKSRNISQEILAKFEKLFNDCDMIRYAPAIFDEQKMKQSYDDLQACLAYLEKIKI